MPIIDGKLCVAVDEGRGGYRAARALVVNVKDGSVLVYVPGGEFEMGDGKEGNCPKHGVYLDGYWIGVYCVTNGQYGRFVGETGHRAPDQANGGTPVWKGGRCPEEKLGHPVVCVSREDAMAYAKWAGCGLPSEAQWEKAARGPGGLIYPWGNEWDADKCRNSGNKGNGETSEVWGYGAGVSGYGTYQQSGNVWEWCGDWHEEGYYGKSAKKNPVGPASGSYRVRRGCSWGSGDASPFRGPPFRGAYRDSAGPSRRNGSLGFRLARIA